MINIKMFGKSYFHLLFFYIPVIIFLGCDRGDGVELEIDGKAMTEQEFLAELNRLRDDKIIHGPGYNNILKNGFELFLSWVCDYHKDLYMKYGAYNISYLNMLEKNVNDEHKTFVLECFKYAPQFISIIEKKDWLSEAYPTLLKHIEEPANKIDSRALSVFIKTAGPEDVPILVGALNKSLRDAPKIVKFISVHMSRSQLSTIIEATWKDTFCANCYETLEFSPLAISYGVTDALRYVVLTLDSPGVLLRYLDNRGTLRPTLENSIRNHTNYNGDFENLVSWYHQNADSLIYDETKRKFIVKQ